MVNFQSVLSDFPATGHVFIISGRTSDGAQKFDVSLACGKSNCDIALKLDVNIAENVISRSSLVGGNWSSVEDDENLTSNARNPVKSDDDFTIYILISDERFHVSVNEKPFCTYNYKVPVKSIRAVSVSGDVDCISQMDHRLVFPLLYPLVNNDTPDIAFSGYIPKKFQPGHVVVVTATPSGSPQGEFVIMFTENDCARQLIHFNPRFDEQTVVMNTMNGCDE